LYVFRPALWGVNGIPLPVVREVLSEDVPQSPRSIRDVEKESVSKDKTMSDSALRIAFLWKAYEPKFWYWEVVETTRRLFLTAVLSVIPENSSQSVIAVLLSIIYIKLYGYYAPYLERSDDILAEMGQYQIFCTFFAVLSIKYDILSGFLRDVLGWVLIVVNLSISYYFFYSEFAMDPRQCLHDDKGSDAEYEDIPFHFPDDDNIVFGGEDRVAEGMSV
jgi:hypothetical protein